MVTKEEQQLFMELVEKCKGIMKSCGFELPTIEYVLNNRFTRTLGLCTKEDYDTFKIDLATYVLQGYSRIDDYKAIESVILHEMCHTLESGLNHGEVWKRYVGVVNSKYGYNIARTVTVSSNCYDAIGVAIVNIGCRNCTNMWNVPSTRKFAKYPEKYTCECGGELFIK